MHLVEQAETDSRRRACPQPVEEAGDAAIVERAACETARAVFGTAGTLREHAVEVEGLGGTAWWIPIAPVFSTQDLTVRMKLFRPDGFLNPSNSTEFGASDGGFALMALDDPARSIPYRGDEPGT